MDRDGMSLSESILSQTESGRVASYSRYGSGVSMVLDRSVFTLLLAFLEGQGGGNPAVPQELGGVCGYAPDPATLNASECPNQDGKLANCTTAGRGTSYRLCRPSTDCTSTLCTVHEKRCIPNGGSVVVTPEQLQHRPRCIDGGQCDGTDLCREVQVYCNQCVPARWKIKTTTVVGPGNIFDVASNPGEDSNFDFTEDEAKDIYPGDSHMQCAVDYLRDAMRCLADMFVQCQEGQSTPCEEGLAFTSTCVSPPESECP
jgi:hypothetical protein